MDVNWKMLEFIDSRRLHRPPNIIATLERNIPPGGLVLLRLKYTKCDVLYDHYAFYINQTCSDVDNYSSMISYIITLYRQ